MGIKNTFGRMIEAREKQARRYVNGALLTLDDATLDRAGYNRKDLMAEGFTAYPY